MRLGLNWNGIAPDRQLDVGTIDMLNRQLVTEINRRIDEFSGSNKLKSEFKLELLDDIAAILKLPEEEMIMAIQIFKDKYRDNNIPILIKLLTDKAAELEPGRKGISQPDPFMSGLPSASPKKISASLPDDSDAFPIGLDPMVVKFDEKYNSGRFDAAVARKSLEDVGIIKPKSKVKKISWNRDSDRFLYEFISVWLIANRKDLFEKLNSLSNADYNTVITEIIKMGKDRGGYNIASSVDDTVNRDHSHKQLIELFTSITPTIEGLIDALLPVAEGEPMPGGRRRRRSRHHKKRRTTLTRRRVKGRRTRKGKRRRSTKRRR